MSAAQLSTFSVNGHLFGVEVAAVQEVIRYQPMTRVPLAPAALAGLINLRGQVVTAVDLRRRLGFPERAAGELAMDVIVRTGDGLVSLVVDRIGDVVEAPQDAFEEPPETLGASPGSSSAAPTSSTTPSCSRSTSSVRSTCRRSTTAQESSAPRRCS